MVRLRRSASRTFRYRPRAELVDLKCSPGAVPLMVPRRTAGTASHPPVRQAPPGSQPPASVAIRRIYLLARERPYTHRVRSPEPRLSLRAFVARPPGSARAMAIRRATWSERSVAPMLSTMVNSPLTVSAILRYAVNVHGDRTVTTATGNGSGRPPTARSAGRLRDWPTPCVGSARRRPAGRHLHGNNQEHLEAYVAIPSMGAVLYTLNIRLFPEQIEFIAYEARGPPSSSTCRWCPFWLRCCPAWKPSTHYGRSRSATAISAPLQASG